MLCYKCKKKIDLPDDKIKFKDRCEYCDSYLHVCKNCKYYSPGKPNDCSILGTEYVTDKEKYNFCEEFKYNETPLEEKKLTKEEISKKLFKD